MGSNEPLFRTEFAEEIIDLSIDNGKKSKRLLSVIENFNSVISNGWANGIKWRTHIYSFYGQ